LSAINYLNDFSGKLLEIRKSHKTIRPLKREGQKFIDELLQLLLPHFSERYYNDRKEIESEIILLKGNLKEVLRALGSYNEDEIEDHSESFFNRLPGINEKLWLDAKSITEGDPAAENIDEVILAYPGFLAIAIYRLAHSLYLEHIPIIPRIISEYAHQLTGIDIHPGAEIGTSFCIDHGTGIVIGETAVIGNNVKIYQGVTLGALSVEKKFANTRRHPTIEDNVVIYAQAVILGGNTIIGANSVIGGNTWITESIPPNSIVYHKSDVKLRKNSNEDFLDFII
jgi:serine O-acetyltransferase